MVAIPESFKVASPQGQNTELEMVEQLINSESGVWKEDLIKKTFLPLDVEKILGIPLSPRLPVDTMVWAWSKNGLFTVMNAYGVSLKL